MAHTADAAMAMLSETVMACCLTCSHMGTFTGLGTGNSGATGGRLRAWFMVMPPVTKMLRLLSLEGFDKAKGLHESNDAKGTLEKVLISFDADE
jgi:hypothetical protein